MIYELEVPGNELGLVAYRPVTLLVDPGARIGELDHVVYVNHQGKRPASCKIWVYCTLRDGKTNEPIGKVYLTSPKRYEAGTGELLSYDDLARIGMHRVVGIRFNPGPILKGGGAE